VLTFGAPGAQFGVEQIAIRSACAEASLPSIVRRLALGGVPTSIWWTDDFAAGPPLDALVRMGRQIVYDSRQWTDFRRGLQATQTIASTTRTDLADLTWQQLSAIREALAHAVDSLSEDDEREFDAIVIRHRRDDLALAWLLAGWIGATFGAANSRLDVAEQSDQQERLRVSLGRLTVTLDDTAAVARSASRAAPFAVAVPQRSEAEAVALELRAFERDPSLYQALERLFRQFAISR
jgi:glucose-6-phosphate dehydrogenase assembly protein OpcA